MFSTHSCLWRFQFQSWMQPWTEGKTVHTSRRDRQKERLLTLLHVTYTGARLLVAGDFFYLTRPPPERRTEGARNVRPRREQQPTRHRAVRWRDEETFLPAGREPMDFEPSSRSGIRKPIGFQPTSHPRTGTPMTF